MSGTEPLRAPFPYFGGKRRVAADVWQRFGDVPNYVEPFFGSGAVLFGRPGVPGIETINDMDGYVANVWRSIKLDPEQTAHYADNPVNECDLHARHCYLIEHKGKLAARLMADPDYHDPRIAGYWAHGTCCWIGSGFCSGQGPWRPVPDEDGILALTKADGGGGVSRKIIHLGTGGQGLNRQMGTTPETIFDPACIARQLPFVGNAGRGINRQIDDAPGVNRQLPHLAANKGYARQNAFIYDWFERLANRLRHVRVCCGDWSRVVTPSVTEKNGITGLFLDPPYPSHDRVEVYTHDCGDVAYAVRDWAIANGGNPKLRIALCGYDGHWDMPDDWEAFAWKTAGGYGSQGAETRGADNAHRERIWFSPACLRHEQGSLF